MSAEEIKEELRNTGNLPVAMRMVNYLIAKNEILDNWKNAFFVQLYIYNKEAASTFSDSFLKDLAEVDEIYDAENLLEEYEEWKSESDWFKDYSISKVVSALKDEGVEVMKDKCDEDYTIRFFSKEGEDLFWVINKPKSAEDFAKKVEGIAENFDDEEHVRELLEAKNNGMQDIPSLKALVHDAEWIQERLNQLAEVANKAAGIEKMSIKEILDRAKKEKEKEKKGTVQIQIGEVNHFYQDTRAVSSCDATTKATRD